MCRFAAQLESLEASHAQTSAELEKAQQEARSRRRLLPPLNPSYPRYLPLRLHPLTGALALETAAYTYPRTSPERLTWGCWQMHARACAHVLIYIYIYGMCACAGANADGAAGEGQRGERHAGGLTRAHAHNAHIFIWDAHAQASEAARARRLSLEQSQADLQRTVQARVRDHRLHTHIYI